jgi:UDP-MurNAc hydroxylase
MKITFVNHASLIFSQDDIHLITDPWIEGKVFHNGWSLLSKGQFTFSDFENITHLWFSHEHPDHFSPPNINSIPLVFREKITVLYHQTKDKKVIEFCKKSGFKEVIELQPNKEFELSPNFKIINTPIGSDSWLYVKTNEHTYLNTNDCVIDTKKEANKIFKTIGEIDVLLTQFSYASKHGNKNQPEKRKKAIIDKQHQIKIQIETFNPKFLIPIASFVWFSHEENFYMNDEMYTIDKVEKFLTANGVTPVVLYPGNVFSTTRPHSNEESVQKYLNDLKTVNPVNATKTQSISIEKIKESSVLYIKRLKKEDLLAFLLISIYPIKIHLTDLNKAVKFSALFGLQEIETTKEKINLFMTSEVLDFCLRFNWGFGTTKVNGRYQANSDKDVILFNYYSSVGSSLNHKNSTLNRVLSKIIRKIKDA